MTGQLHFLTGPLAGQIVDLPPEQGTLLGRAGTCPIAVKANGVSRIHCRIDFQDDEFHLVDFGSVNGTFVNGEHVYRHILQDGDRIRVGVVDIAFRIAEGDPSEKTGTSKIRDSLKRIHWVCEQCGSPIRVGAEQETIRYAPGDRILCERCLQTGHILKRQIGRFRIVRKIAYGGVGTVFKAYQDVLDRPVALKVLKSELAEDSTMIRRFIRGASTGAHLAHPNIVQVYDAGEADGLYYIAMEYVDGPSVADVLTTRGYDRVQEVLRIAVHIARALVHASKYRIVHRDIKPSNILVARTGVAKLSDLELAKCLDDAGLTTITHTGESLGTTDYMSPEQFEDGPSVDHRSDIYGLGVTLYEMLTGDTPFPARNLVEKLEKIRGFPPPSPRVLNPKVPEPFAVIVQTMMAKNPINRYQTPQDLLRSLLEVREAMKAR
jgi:hypothetical protein